jgi:excisionase family DNA binding protein
MSKGTAKMKPQEHQFPEEVRDQSTEALRRLRAADFTKPVEVYVNGTENEPITLPSVVLGLFTEVLARVAADQPVSIVTPDAVFTTQQAADMLNVSRPYLIKLIDRGDLPAHKVGRHRRIKASNLEEYRRRQQAAARAAARDMARLTADWEGDN